MTPAELLQAIERLGLSLQQASDAMQADGHPDMTPMRDSVQRICTAIGALPAEQAKALLPPLQDAVKAADHLQETLTQKAEANGEALAKAEAIAMETGPSR